MVTAAAALLVAGTLAGHHLLPDRYGLGSFVESFLPWLGVPVLLLLLVALLRRSLVALAGVLVAALTWTVMFGAGLLPKKRASAYDLRVVSQNMLDGNPDPTGTARALKRANADVIAVQELTSATYRAAARQFDESYPYHERWGTLAVWSRYPIAGEAQPVDIGIGWVRAFRVPLSTPEGRVELYNVHLASLKVGAEGFESGQRDRTLRRLARAIAGDRSRHLVVVGDLNTAATDRSFRLLAEQLTPAHEAGGHGFGFTWPAAFPMTRIDHILVRGLTVSRASVLPSTGSDHRAVAADLTLG
ncbi:hypothetical protein TH66_15455 [Carbonactinospora thermoautotrophica]|uniref:Endonuclease/exonuclease/phosphatase domain-containing protein n=1 Tax=Carbonactinospora thermoautotrophica TaxID=1469144 RepID=A0A132MS41_9ACTN|nr:hypothetical protein TH66_15455 [Carbonactinospora thermoautotrophica]